MRQAVVRAPCGLLLALAAGCAVTPYGKPGDPPRAATEVRAQDVDGPQQTLPEEIGASHLLVQFAGAQGAKPAVVRTKQEAKQRAEEALAKARGGAEFGELVSEYSDEPGAGERGGALGRFPHHAMVKPFADAAFHLEIGEISDVVESPFGYHVILRTE
jgi:peptidyl-prolyl cis-trans isomerase NIMA-interacting 1